MAVLVQNSSNYWFARYEEKLAIADQYKNQDCRRIMENVANDYLNMALRVEGREKQGMHIPLPNHITVEVVNRVKTDLYDLAIQWMLKKAHGLGGWPPRDINKVSGWKIVEMTAELYGRDVKTVAKELIEAYEQQR